MDNFDAFLESTFTEKLLVVGKGISISLAIVSIVSVLVLGVLWFVDPKNTYSYGMSALTATGSFLAAILSLAVLEIERHLRPKDK